MALPPADKTALRDALRAMRRAIPVDTAAQAATQAALQLADVLRACSFAAGSVASVYMPLRDELDPRPAAALLRADGWRIALPVTVGRAQALSFRLYHEGDPLTRSAFGVDEPVSGAVVVPDVVVVPLLGFDHACHRLGFGAGHYDCTLAELRAEHKVMAVGLAFDVQCVARGLPHESHDQPLDCVVTDKSVYWPQPVDAMKG